MSPDRIAEKEAYARLIVQGGVNLQAGQALFVVAELAHREFVRLIVAAAYDAGARYVSVDWRDPLLNRIRYQHVEDRYLEFVPEYEIPRRKEVLSTGWAYVALTGSEYPDALEDIDPTLIRRERIAWSRKLDFWQRSVMNNEISWCVAGAPTAAWAQKVFPELDAVAAQERLWEFVLRACRADQADPLQAWREHDARLKGVAAFLDRRQVRAIRYLDEKPGPDGRPSTDLTVGLTDSPAWSCGSAINAQGLPFFANIPSEEVFTSPHKDRVNGWVRTSKPGFSMEQRVEDAYFRFQDGRLVEWDARIGRDALGQVFEIPGARQLGEISLVDIRSPINQSGLIFHDVLYDENAVCHIAFGRAYPEGVRNGNGMSSEELARLGINNSDAHEDMMIGTETMRVIGLCADGSEVVVMEQGMFVDDALIDDNQAGNP